MVSTAVVSQYLEGLDFPALKDEIVSYAEDRNASPEALDALKAMPEPMDGRYYSMAAVWDALGEVA